MPSIILPTKEQVDLLLNRISDVRASKLDNLDALISSRMPGTMTHRDRIDAAISSRAEQGTVNTISTNVGSNADAASATGSVHGKLKDIRANMFTGLNMACYASDTVRMNAPTERSTNGTSWSSYKQFLINHMGTVRVTYEVYVGGSHSGSARVMLNGSIIGNEFNTSSESYVFRSMDVSVLLGDIIGIDIRKTSQGGSNPHIYIRNAMIRYDLTPGGLVVKN